MTTVHHLALIAANDPYRAELVRRIAPAHVLVFADRDDLIDRLRALAHQLPVAPRALDHVGLTGAEKLVTFDGRPLDTRIGRVRASYRELAEQGVLARLGVVALRVVGCTSSIGEPARHTLAQLAEIVELEVTGTTELVTIDDFGPAGFTAPPPRRWTAGARLDLDGVACDPLRAGARPLAVAQARDVLACIGRDAGVALPGLLASPQLVIGLPRGDRFHHLELLLDHELVRTGTTVFPVEDPRRLRALVERYMLTS